MPKKYIYPAETLEILESLWTQGMQNCSTDENKLKIQQASIATGLVDERIKLWIYCRNRKRKRDDGRQPKRKKSCSTTTKKAHKKFPKRRIKMLLWGWTLTVAGRDKETQARTRHHPLMMRRIEPRQTCSSRTQGKTVHKKQLPTSYKVLRERSRSSTPVIVTSLSWSTTTPAAAFPQQER
ncbi:uncharacterized protein LOC120807032 isoform X3 [Xiphias gladius]|uniref:uncharacterized protein LOC120807032 isoform X3 n=1 Tax=Xiphias gladius TaxID=8245 RepID=UPI001A988526|nr:uncharacterized protein LOC120807032 isoform X3 [Xiphias gladius]